MTVLWGNKSRKSREERRREMSRADQRDMGSNIFHTLYKDHPVTLKNLKKVKEDGESFIHCQL